MRRPLPVVAALGLLVDHTLSQYYDALAFISDDIKPRFWEQEIAEAEAPSLVKRDGDCGSGKHPCSDVDSNVCCNNEQYCIVNSTWGVQCCALGSDCLNQSKCNATYWYANITTTSVATVTLSAASGSSIETTTAETNTSVCSPRICTSTNYLCASSFGGGCCPYGYDCASSGLCIGPSTTVSASTSVPALVSPVPSGCSAQGDTLCTAGAGISGSGCCGAGFACITYSASLMCSATPTSSSSSTFLATPTGSGVTVEHLHGSGGLSTGAKAGIAVGVIVAAAVVIGGLTWLCIRRRRSGRSTTTGNEMRSVPPNENNTPGAAVAGAYSDGAGGRPQYGAGGRNLSESGYAPSSTQIRSDYFSGPYSDHRESNIGPVDDGANNNTWESAAATAGTPLAHEQEYYHGYQDEPPQQQQRDTPHGPDDVLAPVEIGHGGSVKGRPKMMGGAGSDISNRGRGYSQAGSDGGHSELADTSGGVAAAARAGPGGRNPSYQEGRGGVRDSIAGRFELYGSETAMHDAAAGGGYLPQPFPTPGSEMSEFATPSPMSREEEQHPRRDV